MAIILNTYIKLLTSGILQLSYNYNAVVQKLGLYSFCLVKKTIKQIYSSPAVPKQTH